MNPPEEQLFRSPTGWKTAQELQSGPPPEREYADWESHVRLAEERERNEWHRTQVRGGIQNVLAKEIVVYLHNLASTKVGLPWRLEGADYLDSAVGVNRDSRIYRDWVRKALRKSDLADRLPLGLQGFPDICEQMKEPWRSLEKLKLPKSYGHLIHHFVRHLDWYLDPVRPVKLPISEIRDRVDGWVALAGCFVSPFIFLAWGILSRLMAWIWGAHRVGRHRVHQYHHLKDIIHAAELFYYLSERYQDPDEIEIRPGFS